MPRVTDVVAVPDHALDGAALLVAVPQSMQASPTSSTTLTAAGASVRSQALVGSHARRYTVAADGKLSAGTLSPNLPGRGHRPRRRAMAM